MTISLRRISRKLETSQSVTLAELPATWTFSLTDERREETAFDFSELAAGGRQQLAAQIRDAIWSQRHECRPITLKRHFHSLQVFVKFLDEHDGTSQSTTALEDIDRALVDRFVGWLYMRAVTDQSKKTHGQLLTMSARAAIYGGLKAFLVNRLKHVPTQVSSRLSFPKNPFPNRNRVAKTRAAYSNSEHKRIVAALNADLRSIHDPDAEPLQPLQVLAVHLIVLALASGRNQQPLLDLTRDSLEEHPAPDRDLLVTYKNRGYGTHATSTRKAPAKPESSLIPIPASVGDHLRFLCEYTASLAAEAGPDIGPYVFLRRLTKYENKGKIAVLNGTNAFQAVEAFSARHKLVDDDGAPHTLNISRLRPTFATEIYRRTGDVRRVQQALGHASPRTAVRHYIAMAPDSERNHAFVIEGMVSQFKRMEVAGRVLIAADGTIPASGVKGLLAGGYSTGIASCRNPFREEDSVCKKFFSCFRCPSMLVFEDDLWRLFSFYYRLLAERVKVGPAHWLKTYAPIVQRIDVDIAPQFPPELVEMARVRARASPHPTWR